MQLNNSAAQASASDTARCCDFDQRYMPGDEEETDTITRQMLSLGEEIGYRAESEKQTLWIFEPQDRQAEELLPCIFFIHGGWGGYADAFAPQRLHFSKRGFATISIHFRGPKDASRFGPSPVNCLADAHAAHRWVKEKVEAYHIAPERIVVTGGSAGGTSHWEKEKGKLLGYHAEGDPGTRGWSGPYSTRNVVNASSPPTEIMRTQTRPNRPPSTHSASEPARPSSAMTGTSTASNAEALT